MNTLIKNCRLGPKGNQLDILISGEKITRIEKKISEIEFKDEELMVVDGTGLTAVPGFIDMHVHLRDPGLEYKEDVKSGTMAAAKGGYTTVFSMPNTRPTMDDGGKLREYLKTIKAQAVIKVMPVAAITEGLKGETLTDMKELSETGAKAFSDDGRPVYNNEIFEKAMTKAKEGNYLIFDHCEDLELAHGGAINKGEASKRLGLKGINNASEALPISRDIETARKVGGKVHICHVSTEESVELIRRAKKDGVKITCEAGPHHLGLNDSIITEGYTDCKVNPPLRTEKDRLAVIEGIIDGTIDVIATDHAPHHENEKGSDFYQAAFGISGIETAFSVCYTELVKKEYISFEKLIQLMSIKPAEITGLEAGRLEVGRTADITLVDLEREIIIDSGKFLSKGHNTPFHGRRYFGEIRMTFVDGRLVYRLN